MAGHGAAQCSFRALANFSVSLACLRSRRAPWPAMAETLNVPVSQRFTHHHEETAPMRAYLFVTLWLVMTLATWAGVTYLSH